MKTMKIMKAMKHAIVALISISVIAVFILAGCHRHSNPLLATGKTKKEQAVKFLVAAGFDASQKTHLYDSSQSVYVICVQNPAHFNNPLDKTAKNPCNAYLQAMVSYANKTKGFKGLTINDLKDQSVIKIFRKPILDEMIKQGF